MSAGAALGAVAGAAVDIMSAGLSFGTGTLIGAALGSAWQGVGQFGSQLAARLTGKREIWLGDDALTVMAARNLALIAALERRGHAAQSPIQLTGASDGLPFDGSVFLKALTSARLHPIWAERADPQVTVSSARVKVLRAVVNCLSQSPLLPFQRADGVHLP